jgi:hypothetical protein
VIFLGALAALLAMRVLATTWLPLRLLSVSTANLAGVALFVLLGVVFQGGDDVWVKVGIVLLAYGALLIGETVGSRLRIDESRWRRAGAVIIEQRLARRALALFAVLYIALPLARTGSEGDLATRIKDVWELGGAREYAEATVQQNYAQATRPRGEAAAAGLRAQLPGLFLLAAGVIFARSRRLAYIVLCADACLGFVFSFGGRTGLMVGLGIPMVLFLGRLRRRWGALVLGGAIALAALLLLGVLRQARSGGYTQASLPDQVMNTLSVDFAYGGLGLEFLHLDAGSSLRKGLVYLGRMVIMPVPRSFWPSKPIVDPNWEMTEAFFGGTLAGVGVLRLFTPLGEALFYFGKFGLFLIPFGYGLLGTSLERLYRASKAFSALFAQLLIWSFLCWRLTLWNLFGAVVVGNLTVLLLLWMISPHGLRLAQATREAGADREPGGVGV